MKIKGLFPDAPFIPASAVRPGDTIVYPNLALQTLTVATVAKVDDHGQVLVENAGIIGGPGDGYYLVHRSAAPLPTEPGSMIRILNPGTHPSAQQGVVLTRQDADGRFAGEGLLTMSGERINEYGITWEQVWLTNVQPLEDEVADAQVVEDDEPAMPLPAGPVLIHITGGPEAGTLLRRTINSRHDFQGIMPDGAFIGMAEADIEAHGWEAVNHHRNDDYYATPAF